MRNSPVLFNQTKPAIIRIWHWLAFLFFAATVTTVILASTLFKARNNIDMVQAMVKEKGGIITPDQAKNVAHEYNDKLWNLHKYIGFGLAFLMLWRIVAEVVVAKNKKMSSRIKVALGYTDATHDKKHYLMVQCSYLIFYLLFLTMATTGLILAFEDVELLKPLQGVAKNIHSIVQWGLYGFMIFHIVGVIIADCGEHGGIVSRMINGKESR